MILLEALYGTTIKLKGTVLTLQRKFSEVAKVIGDAENVRIRINWLDRLNGETH